MGNATSTMHCQFACACMHASYKALALLLRLVFLFVSPSAKVQHSDGWFREWHIANLTCHVLFMVK